MIKQTPSWTMTSRKFYIHQEVTPGPGSYSVQSTLSGPNYRIGTSARSFLASTEKNPGPGSYSPNKLLPSQPKI